MFIGIIAGGIVSIFWIGMHIIRMHIRPAENRFKSILAGYLVSLPLVALACLAFSEWDGLKICRPSPEAWGASLLLAYVWHLLLFFAFCEFFYMVERSVTLRFLIELWRRPAGQAQIELIQADYNVEVMIRNRLAVLNENNFIELKDGKWQLKAKGLRMVKAMRISAWIYQSVDQPNRL